MDAAKVEADGTSMSARIRDVGLPAMHPGTVLPGDLVQKSGRADLEDVERLVAAYASAGTADLRRALVRFKRDLCNRKTLAQLGLTLAR